MRRCNRFQSSCGGHRYFGRNSEKKLQHTPNLSPRSRRDLFVLTLGASGAATYLWLSNDVEQDLQIAVDSLLSRSKEGMASDMSEELPPPVKRYLDEVLPVQANSRRHKLSAAKQSGEFLAGDFLRADGAFGGLESEVVRGGLCGEGAFRP